MATLQGMPERWVSDEEEDQDQTLAVEDDIWSPDLRNELFDRMWRAEETEVEGDQDLLAMMRRHSPPRHLRSRKTEPTAGRSHRPG